MTDALREALPPMNAPMPDEDEALDAVCDLLDADDETRSAAAWVRKIYAVYRTALQEPAPVVAREPVTHKLAKALRDLMAITPMGSQCTVIWDRARKALGEYHAALHQAPVEPAPVVQPQCGVCGAFIKPGRTGKCANCGTEWDNGTAAQPEPLAWLQPALRGPFQWQVCSPTSTGAFAVFAAPSQLVEDARAKAIEECAKVAEDFVWHDHKDCPPDEQNIHIAAAIRAIAKGVES